MLSAVQNGPSNATGVLSLQEQRLGLAILETEDLAVATDIDFTLRKDMLAHCQTHNPNLHDMVFPARNRVPPSFPIIYTHYHSVLCPVVLLFKLSSTVEETSLRLETHHDDREHCIGKMGSKKSYLARVNSLAREGIVVGTHLVAVVGL